MVNNSKKDPILPYAVIIILILTVFVISVGLYANYKPLSQNENTSSVITQKYLHFYDHNNGAVRVTDENGEDIKIFNSDAGFVKVVLRTLVKERISQGVGPEKPFLLAVRENGLLSLLDPLTGAKVDVSSFGEVNAKAFFSLLQVGPDFK
ncbi:MAG: hypothetical protein CBC42_03930 [Betaproteobacteria bacterium TMED82]|nr:MAG: hypothetical protein CBC42_03930 [Betaproteobacteria bacterium TMED82]|tara:strand:- start:52929 stop:53378 length:450 start_codon:yes stop_codon:yes gene_type:complete